MWNILILVWDNWIKMEQLDVTCFIISLLLFNMFRMLIHSSSGTCELLWIYLMVCIALVRCVLVLRCGLAGVVWCGVLSLRRLKQCFSLHKDTTPPQPNHTVTPTHIEPEQYNTWNKSTISRKLLKMGIVTFETCWAVNSEIIKQVTWSWSIFIQLLRNIICIIYNSW